ncbi:MAG TPA: M20/M25/M40 family metallo-hydrolase [bacterium]|nr:M20/M25/M40 family metallo-hydrolase [bacterium]
MTSLVLIGFIAGVMLVVIVRALMIKAPAARPERPATLWVDAELAARHLSALVRIPTVSSRDTGGWEPARFKELIELLPELYPETHRALARTIVRDYSLLYRWQGVTHDKPLALMAHYDVVPADPDGWTRGPFSGDIHDGRVWGRGTLDTKCTMVCAFEAVEALVKQGFVPAHDVYLAFGHNEEIGGDGATGIVSHLEALGIRPALVLDEGGAVVSGIFPGIARPMAMLGVAEKGVTDIELSVMSQGGHASTPPRRGAAWRLARAITRLEARPFAMRFPVATRVMFSRLAPHASFGLRLVLANLWLFEPLLLRVFAASGGELNALCRTTTAVTMLEGSAAANVLPAVAKAVVNVRVAIGQTAETAAAHLANVIADPLVAMRVLLPGDPSPVSELEGGHFDALTRTVTEVYPDAIIAPYVVLGGTDARHFCAISRNVYRFSPFELSKAERASMHAVNEAIPVASLAKGVEFYTRLIRNVGGTERARQAG